MYENSIDVVFTLEFGEGRQSPSTRFRKAIELGPVVLAGVTSTAVTRRVGQTGQGAVVEGLRPALAW